MANKTIVLVHGAFAESASWNSTINILEAQGHSVIALANPLRGVQKDAAYLASLLETIQGPIVLVGHSYGGMVITNAVTGNRNVKALVYVAGFAPEKGESAAALSARYPGSTLGPALASPVALPDGDKDLYIQPDKFWLQFAADVSQDEAKLMAVTQRPCTETALNEISPGEPAWKAIPSWFIFGELDKNIPASVHAFMAQRAESRVTVQIKGGSHALMVSHPEEVAQMIEAAVEAS